MKTILVNHVNLKSNLRVRVKGSVLVIHSGTFKGGISLLRPEDYLKATVGSSAEIFNMIKTSS